jgi:site-specific recombinase XerC
MVGEPDAFLRLAKSSRTKAEDRLIDVITSRREKEAGKGQTGSGERALSGATIAGRLAMVKSFLDFYEVELNWKRIKQTAPPSRMVSMDRSPTVEELRKILHYARPREKVAILFMASGGMRVGALPPMKLGDITRLESGVARVKVYPGTQDQHWTFVSREAVDALDAYLDERKRVAFEEIGPESPLLREKAYYRPEPKPIGVVAIQVGLFRLWVRAGIRVPHQKQEFKSAHGLRKFFKTQLSRAGLKWEDQESLLGHFLNYYKPSVEDLERQYIQAQDFLSIDEAYALKQRIKTQEKAHETEWTRVHLENLELREKLREHDDVLRELGPLIAEMKEERMKELAAAKRET